MNNILKDLKIEYLPTEQLMPYENNANIHTDEQVEQIVASIKEFGFNDPVAVWTNEDGESEIVEGHGRVLAAKKLGMDSLPVIHLDGLSDEARRAYTHIHNQLTRNSKFDFDTLQEEIANLNFDFDDFGFDAIGLITDVSDFYSSVSSEELDEYEEKAEEDLKSFNVILCCLCEEDREYVSKLINEKGNLKRLYMVQDLREGTVE